MANAAKVAVIVMQHQLHAVTTTATKVVQQTVVKAAAHHVALPALTQVQAMAHHVAHVVLHN
jgi:hypothetical protein